MLKQLKTLLHSILKITFEFSAQDRDLLPCSCNETLTNGSKSCMRRDGRFGGRFSCTVKHPSLCKDLIHVDQNEGISADACEDKNQGNYLLLT